ncbi:polysaccharide pyruvyl transferase family protein [Thioalkalivibrio sp. AKL17]|uniref:polysaccharide pyruvyl transferase family protein n=1 Tax=Thioalkalivibrio sp. AKL17 TaxID=1158160 RepID=UPI0009DA8391|nr:polysaccharide pyruvyl transferase family protein [Thioalkalivibrio sp. AKL17]
MTKIFLSGHRDFGNRGCEAIVRSTVDIVRKAIPGAEFVVPSTNIERDRALWPEAEGYGVTFSDCLRQSIPMRVFGKARKRLDRLNNRYPPVRPPAGARRLIDDCDAVLAVGGDNYSEDYSLPFMPVILDRYAMDQGLPVVLWGASVGPFGRSKRYEEFMARHMRRYSMIHVREARSERYCREVLGVSRLRRFSDPAFALEPQTEGLFELGEENYIGVNVSPLVLGKLGERAEAFIRELVCALKAAHDQYGFTVLLLPHVMSYQGPNDDRKALDKVKRGLDSEGVANVAVTDEINAAQIKGLIRRCRVFMGARTHATIAAMSMGVPVISIGYSVKATGINEMVFGHDRFVVDYRGLESAGLLARINEVLEADEAVAGESVRERLRADAERAGESFRELVRPRSGAQETERSSGTNGAG